MKWDRMTGEVKTVAGDIRRTKKYRELKSSMEDSLRSRGLIEPVYTELLSRYLDLWCEYQNLTTDINERGVTVMDEKRGMLVENRSLTIRHQTSNKMLDIYAALGFRDISAPRTGAKANSPTGIDDEL
ncbi:MAG: P27 family phage terminase small subunit [Oscillospiraceae bacterium]|nr:P27 family phage terminase small subunit [Oscillospiraceae bacterium]